MVYFTVVPSAVAIYSWHAACAKLQNALQVAGLKVDVT